MLLTLEIAVALCLLTLAVKLLYFLETTNLMTSMRESESRPLEAKFTGPRHLPKQPPHLKRRTCTCRGHSESSLAVCPCLAHLETLRRNGRNMGEIQM